MKQINCKIIVASNDLAEMSGLRNGISLVMVLILFYDEAQPKKVPSFSSTFIDLVFPVFRPDGNYVEVANIYRSLIFTLVLKW